MQRHLDADGVGEPRAQRGWKGEGGPSGAEISYRLASAGTGQARVLIVNAKGDTIARLTGPTTAGVNKVTWNFTVGNGDAAVLLMGERNKTAMNKFAVIS